MSAYVTQQLQDTASGTVTFSVTVQDTCPSSTPTFGSALVNMTASAISAAVSQPLIPAVDPLAAATSNPNLCGPITYVIVESYPFVSIDLTNALIKVQSTLMAEIGTYTATFRATFDSYPLSAPA